MPITFHNPKSVSLAGKYSLGAEVPGGSRLLYVSGQVAFAADGTLMRGRLGEDRDLDYGIEAARHCGLMIVAQIKAALGGDLSRVQRVVKLGVFVNSTADFTDQPRVANGASDLMVALFGDAGKHARSAVGVPSLPFGVAVEIDAVVQVSGSALS